MEIVRSCRYVDAVVPQEELDKFKAWQKLRFDLLFVGDDWFGSDNWEEYEQRFDEVGVRVVYFPYTKGTSSTLINETLKKLRSAG
jgi:glycerol-3-phosphate cytidylyltransferase